MAGRPPFKPTKQQREDVELMKADGWSNEQIGLQLRIARNTLEQHFADELEYGRGKVRLENLKNLRRLAKKNASAAKQLNDRFDLADTKRPDAPPSEPKPPKLGKKEQEQIAAQNPDLSTEMGELLARRMALN